MKPACLLVLVEIFLVILDVLYKNKQEFITLYEHTNLYQNGILVVPSHHVYQHLVKIDQSKEYNKEYIKEYIKTFNRKNYIVDTDLEDLIFLENTYNMPPSVFSSRKFLSEKIQSQKNRID